MEISSRFDRSFFNLKTKKLLYFMWSAKRGGGGSETLTTKIRWAGPKCFVNIPYLLSIYSLVTLEKFGFLKKIMVELIKSINTSIINLLRRDLACVRKCC